MSDNFKIICELSSPLCGNAPMLDALLCSEMIFKQRLCSPGEKLTKSDPISKFKEPRIPLRSIRYNNIPLYFVSSPIFICNYEFREDFCYHFEPELSFLLSNLEKKSISSTSGIYKDRRLPVRLQIIKKIVWFCSGTKNSTLDILQNIPSIGTKRKQGFGVVYKWSAVDTDKDYSFYVEEKDKRILMRMIPESMVENDMIGYTINYGAVSHPYWHPERFMNIAEPC